MPRIGVETERRQSLVKAAIEVIGRTGSLDVPVKDIARKAGMSPALAFHYFGDKDEIITATMRHLLRALTGEFARGLAGRTDPLARVEAVIEASFAASQFDRNTVAAWLVFYVHAFQAKGAARLLTIYSARLDSNLRHALRGLFDDAKAERVAAGLAALIDGLYVRHALRRTGPDRTEAIALCLDYLDAQRRSHH